MTTYLQPGDVIAGRYQVIRPISQGGMGAVYLAEQTSLGREVAIKVILDGVKDNEMLRRFDLEAKAVCLLKHPNIITYHDYGRDDNGNPYIVMEYLHGFPASQLFDPDRGITLEVLCHVIAQMCSALGEAHRKNIIHRDLKWSNIMICPQGHDEHFAKLIDFGIVKIPADNAMKQGLTQTGMLLGTPQYMPPEAIQGKKVDGRADQYSLAVMLWEGIEGRKPFEADSMFEVFRMHVQDAVPDFERGRKLLDVYPGLEDAIYKAMSKNPEDRYPTVLDFQRAIFESLGLATSSSALESGRTSLPNGVPGVSASGRMRGATGGQPFDTRLRTGASPTKKGMPKWVMGAIAGGVLLAATAGVLVATQSKGEEAAPVVAETTVTPEVPTKEEANVATVESKPENKPTETRPVEATPPEPTPPEPTPPGVAEVVPPVEPNTGNGNTVDGGTAGDTNTTTREGAGANGAGTLPPSDANPTPPGGNNKPEPGTTTTTPNGTENTPVPVKPVEPALPKMRQMIVTVRPWGNVSINGQDYGQSPVDAQFATGRGYKIVVTNPSLGKKEQFVRLQGDRENRPMRITVDFNS